MPRAGSFSLAIWWTQYECSKHTIFRSKPVNTQKQQCKTGIFRWNVAEGSLLSGSLWPNIRNTKNKNVTRTQFVYFIISMDKTQALH